MEPLPPPSSQLLDALARSAAAYGDARALRFTLGLLASFEDPRARFAHALLELSLAKAGEPEAKGNLARIADELLISWRDGNGAEFSRLAPVLEDLWTDAATLMVSFEVHRFTQALELCANSRGDAERLSSAIEKLLPEGNRAVEFARCLYHLELARLGVDSSRVEFARRAGLLAEAYQSKEAAQQLIGTDDGLAQLWSEVLPYLDEFFEMMEEEAARRQPRPSAPPTAPARPSAPESAPQATPSQPEPAVTIPEPQPPPAPVPLAVSPIDATETQPMPTLPPMAPRFASRPSAPPMLAPPVLEPVALGDTPDVPSFRTLLKKAADKEAQSRDGDATLPPRMAPPELPAEPISEENLIEAVEDSGPPELALDEADLVEVAAGMPPPPPMTTGQHPMLRPPPPPPPGPPPPPPGPVMTSTLDAVIEEDYTADEATMDFWRHTFTELELIPAENQPRSPERKLSADSRADRKRLTTYLDSLGPFIEVPEARSFSALVRLLAAGQLKEKTLFGGVNARRAEAFADAFSYLSKNPMSAAHAAEFFVLDGLDTELALRRGLAVLTEYVFWCGAEGRDPLNFDAQTEFAERAKKK